MQFMDSFNSVKFYSKNLRKVLKELADQAPKETNFQELVRIGYENLVATTTVFSGLNPLTGATGTTRAATPADFGFPVAPGPSSSSGKSLPSGSKRKRVEGSETYKPQAEDEQEEQEEEQEDIQFENIGEQDDSPEITKKHNRQLKKLATQCFCGKSGFKTPAEVEKHRLAVHTGHGKGFNPKTKKPKDYWKCIDCNELSGDPRACWKHYRTTHLKNFIHYCPVTGCEYGNDQKDSIVSHIIRQHKEQENREWVDKCYQQNWLRCRKCMKFFTSIKGKNNHEMKCGTPSIKLNCIFENCYKTYKSQEAMDKHVEFTHHGKGHKTLCPHCGEQFSSKQSLDRHLENKHQSL